MKITTTTVSGAGTLLMTVIPAGLSLAFSLGAGSLFGHRFVFLLMGSIFLLIPWVLACSIDSEYMTEIAELRRGCPCCGAACTLVHLNELPFGKSLVVYECMTEIAVRRKKTKLHKSIICGNANDECDTI